ncbi:MAG: hypothetical protein ACI9OJ_000129, partial [Myxococcota bacterium]
ESMSTGGSDTEMDTHALLAASATFDAVVREMSGDSMTAAASSARAQIEAAVAVSAELNAILESQSNSAATMTSIEAAFDALVVATADAQNDDEVAAAGDDFEFDLLADSDLNSADEGSLESFFDGLLGVDVVAKAAFEGFLTAANTSSVSLDAAVSAAAAASLSGSDTFDADSMSSLVVAAWATFQADISTASEAVVTDASSLEVLTSATAVVNAGLFSSASL